MTSNKTGTNKKTILIVDDNADIIKLIVAQLKVDNENWRVLSAANGRVAQNIAMDEVPNIILMDWDMPEVNGIEATRLLKKNEQTHGIPIIMMTGQMTTSEDLQLALEAGAIDYVRKPIDFVELKARIYSVLKYSEQQEAVRSLLKNEIDLKNRKLSTTSMLIVEKNAIMREFHDQLVFLIKSHGAKNDLEQNPLFAEIKSLIKRSSNHLETDDSWDIFKIHFDEVHPDFLNLIRSKGKDISHKDLKLCAYLKLGMETKQIAQLLNITPASIRTAMYRLKKKFLIEEKDDLRHFIEVLG